MHQEITLERNFLRGYVWPLAILKVILQRSVTAVYVAIYICRDIFLFNVIIIDYGTQHYET